MGEARARGLFDDVRVACEDKGVTRLLFVNHAEAVESEESKEEAGENWKMVDSTRSLNDKGVEQAKEARRWFQEGLGTDQVMMCVNSGTRRAVETMQLMMQEGEDKGKASFETKVLKILHVVDVHQGAEELLEACGSAPIKAYLEDEGNKAKFEEYAKVAVEDLMNGIVGMRPEVVGKGNTVAYFGHEVSLPSIVYSLCQGWGLSEFLMNQLLEVELGPAEGLLIELPKRQGSDKKPVNIRYLHTKFLAPPSLTNHPLMHALRAGALVK